MTSTSCWALHINALPPSSGQFILVFYFLWQDGVLCKPERPTWRNQANREEANPTRRRVSSKFNGNTQISQSTKQISRWHRRRDPHYSHESVRRRTIGPSLPQLIRYARHDYLLFCTRLGNSLTFTHETHLSSYTGRKWLTYITPGLNSSVLGRR
jgi:hypothetical protein